MPTLPGGNPMSLGRVVVAASGTPVPVTKNFTDVDTQAEITSRTIAGRMGVKSILVQADPANDALVGGANSFIWVGKKGMVIATGVGVIAKLAPGQYISISDPVIQGNTFNLADFFLDATDANGAAYVSATRS